jgi:hypothetical protein
LEVAVKDFIKTVFASAIGFVIGSVFVLIFSLVLVGVIVGGVMAVNRTKEMSSESIRENSVLYVNVEGTVRERRSTTDFVRDILSEDSPKEIGLFEME